MPEFLSVRSICVVNEQDSDFDFIWREKEVSSETGWCEGRVVLICIAVAARVGKKNIPKNCKDDEEGKDNV